MTAYLWKKSQKKLISDNKEEINDPDDANNFWFALAKAQWECKQLDISFLKKFGKSLRQGKTLKFGDNLMLKKKT